MAAYGRSREIGFRRLCHHYRTKEGADYLGRGKYLSARNRGGAGAASEDSRSCRDWNQRRGARRSAEGVSSGSRRLDGGRQGTSLFLSRQAGGIQGAKAFRGSCGLASHANRQGIEADATPVSYTHLRAHETPEHLVCRLLL